MVKMYALTTIILYLGSFAAIFSSGSSVTISDNVNASCSPYETECALGCCPFADGVCCADGFECCQSGQTCIPFLGICIGLQDEGGKTSLLSSKSTPIRSSITTCPSGTTTCGPDKCCMLANATCCSDGAHCCPQGYRCDVPHSRCIKDSMNQLGSSWSADNGVSLTQPLRMANKSKYKSCPGGNRVCLSYMSCCINDNSEWGCCPNPSLHQLRYGGGECCDTIFGHMCCPDDYPTCTVFGCTK